MVGTPWRGWDGDAKRCFPTVKARVKALERSKGFPTLLRGTRKGLEGLGGLRNGAGNTVRNEQCSIAEWSKARER